MSKRAPTPPVAETDPWRPAGSVVVAALALAWLVIDFGIAYKTITDGALASTQVALFLPTLTAAALVGGAAAGVVAVGRLADRFGGVERALPRIASGAIGGVVAAAVAAGGMVAAYRGSSVVAVTITLAVAAIAGGALAACRPTAAIAGGLAGCLAYAMLTFIQAIFRDRLLNVFGDTSTVATYVSADNRLSLVVSILTGIAGGATAFVFLRRSGLALPWPVYLAAGAVPGLVLLLAEFVSWLGGRSLVRAVVKFSELDGFALHAMQPDRIEHSMIVFFAGAITGIILVGRTMRATR
jgi:MFS family permease